MKFSPTILANLFSIVISIASVLFGPFVFMILWGIWVPATFDVETLSFVQSFAILFFVDTFLIKVLAGIALLKKDMFSVLEVNLIYIFTYLFLLGTGSLWALILL